MDFVWDADARLEGADVDLVGDVGVEDEVGAVILIGNTKVEIEGAVVDKPFDGLLVIVAI